VRRYQDALSDTAWHLVRDAAQHSLPDSRYLLLLGVLIAGLVGYWIGPRDLPLGNYSAQVDLSINGHSLTVVFPFVLGEQQGQPVTHSQSDGRYELAVSGTDVYRYELGQNISFQTQLLDANRETVDLDSADISMFISGAGYGQLLPPTDHLDQQLIFTMRIPYKARIVSALLFAVAALWLTELVPLAAGALLIPVVVVMASVADAGTVLQPYFHPIVVLFLAGFLLAEAMHRTGVDRLIALNILQRSSLKPAHLMLTMMSLTAFLSMWMSNTASVAIIIPIALSVLERIPGTGGQSGFRRALVLGIAYAATVGGIGSAIGTPANILAMTFLNDFANIELGFVDWFLYGVPVVIIMVPLIWLYLILVFRVRFQRVGPHLDHEIYKLEVEEMGGLSSDQRFLILVFVAIMGLWLTDQWHHVHAAIVALAGVLVLFFNETIKKEDLNRINWNALLTFGGGLALGNILVLTGVSDWIALQLIGLVEFPPLLVVCAMAGLTLLIGAFISNTACAAMLIPLAIPLADVLDMDPRLLVAIVAISSSIDFALVIGTPPTMLAYSTGFFEAKDIFKRGIVLDLVAILVLSFGIIWIWQLLGMATW
jgi:sodium-dependent dicarboxylate transporter 2/3/5